MGVPGGWSGREYLRAYLNTHRTPKKSHFCGVQSSCRVDRSLCISVRILLLRTDSFSDGTAKVWDCQEGSELVTFTCKGLPQDLHWNYNGSLFCLSTKDKMDTVYDPRQNGIVAEWSPHNGTKCSKMTWLGDRPHVLTTGFNRSSQREWKMWDLRNLAKPIAQDALDQSSGTLLPFFDPDTSMLYLGGKGDGNIRYYEVMESSLYPLSQYSSTVSARVVPRFSFSLGPLHASQEGLRRESLRGGADHEADEQRRRGAASFHRAAQIRRLPTRRVSALLRGHPRSQRRGVASGTEQQPHPHGTSVSTFLRSRWSRASRSSPRRAATCPLRSPFSPLRSCLPRSPQPRRSLRFVLSLPSRWRCRRARCRLRRCSVRAR